MSETIKDVVNILNKMDARLDKMEDKFENMEDRLAILENPERYNKNAVEHEFDPCTDDIEFDNLTGWYARVKKFAENAADEIMMNFDFEKVNRVMEFLNWRWYGAKNGVPTVDEIKTEVRDHLDELIAHACTEAAENVDIEDLVYEAGTTPDDEAIYDWGIYCGGLHCTIVVFRNGDVRISVRFVLEEYEESNNIDLL